MAVTFEYNSDEEKLEIHGSASALKELARLIHDLAERGSDHEHLMTPSWGGAELAEDRQGKSNELVHHVKVFCWPG